MRLRKLRWASCQPRKKKMLSMKSEFLHLSISKPSLLTKRLSSRTQPKPSVWWWSSKMMKMSTKKFSSIKKSDRISQKTRSGRFLFRSRGALTLCTRSTYFTEIWSVLMSFYLRKLMRSSVISMCPKLRSKVFSTLKLELLTMLLLKFGKTNHTTTRVIYGRSGALFTKWQRSSRLSELRTWMASINLCLKASMNQ